MSPAMPRRETRHDIERELAEQRRRQRARRPDLPAAVANEVKRELVRQRKTLGMDEYVEIHVRSVHGKHKLVVKKGRKRRPGEGGLAVPVEPPRGPRPLQGGAAAPLEFD